jgi:hypothetical protein
VTAAGSSS